MKRMTLLTALALVFSLFTVTTAIAAQGEGTRDAVQGGNTLMAKTHNNEGKCQATDDCPAGAMVMTQTRIRTKPRRRQASASPATIAQRVIRRRRRPGNRPRRRPRTSRPMKRSCSANAS